MSDFEAQFQTRPLHAFENVSDRIRVSAYNHTENRGRIYFHSRPQTVGRSDVSSANSFITLEVRPHSYAPVGISLAMIRIKITAIVAMALLAATFPRLAQAQSGQAILQTGIEAFEAHNFAAAEQAFSQLVQIDASARNYGYLAMAEAADRKLDRAIADFRRSIQLGDNTPNVYYNFGLAYLLARQPGSAIQEFRKAVGVDPKYLPARYALGMALLSSGHAAEAGQILSEARRQAPGDPRLWAGLVEAQFQSGNAREAVETAQNAMQAIPNNSKRQGRCI